MTDVHEEQTFSATCPLDILGNERKPTAKPCGWVTTDHPTQRQADARLAQHLEEHRSGEPMPELIDFLGASLGATDSVLEDELDDESEA